MQFCIKLLLVFIFFNTYLFSNNDYKIIKDWFVSPVYNSKGENSFYLDYLTKYGGEDNFSLTKKPDWEVTISDSNGYVKADIDSGRQITYMYSIITSDDAEDLALTIGYTGGLQIWLNGVKIYSNRISRKPIPDDDMAAFNLISGENIILAKFEGNKSNAGFYFRLYKTEGSLFVNKSKTICPDFRVNHKTNGWGQIEVLNSGSTKIDSLALRISDDSLITSFQYTIKEIKPGEVRKIPFFVSSPKKTNNRALSFDLILEYKKNLESIRVNPLVRNEDNYFVTTYLSELDGSVQPYSVLLPRDFDNKKEYSLILLLHGAWVTDWAQNIISFDPKEWAIQVAVHGRGNNRYREIGEVDLNEVLNSVEKKYNINKNKIYLAGHSMGGYGTWFQAARYPDRWTAISPQAGYANYFLYTNENEMPAFLKKLYKEWSPVLYAKNLLHIPAYIVHGAKDDNVSVEHAREMSRKLDSLNYNFVYDENPEGGHWWGPRGKDYGVEVVDKPSIWSFLLKSEEKVKDPRKVRYKTNSLRYNKAYWVTINELDSIYSMAEFTGEINRNKINITLNNINQFTLSLNYKLIDFNKPVEVMIDKKNIYNDFLHKEESISIKKTNKNSFELIKNISNNDKVLKAKLDNTGKVSKILLEPKRSIKNHRVFGPVTDAFNTPFLFVTGKSSNVELSKAIKNCAASIARTWEIFSNGEVFTKNDDELEKSDLFNYNLILFGNGESNKIISEINKLLPIKFSGKSIEADEKVYSAPGTGFVEVFPSPYNPDKYIVVFGGIDELSFKSVQNYSLEKLPDYVIYNSENFNKDNVEFIEAGFFNKYWDLK